MLKLLNRLQFFLRSKMNVKIDHVMENGVSFQRMVIERAQRKFSGPFVGWRTEEQSTHSPEDPQNGCDMMTKQNSQISPDQADDHSNEMEKEMWASVFSDTTSSSEQFLERKKKPQIDLANYFAGINRKVEQKSASTCFVLKGFTTWSH